jgi:hypothetical protein
VIAFDNPFGNRFNIFVERLFVCHKPGLRLFCKR